ncbi:MAG: SCP2 sterol-binding domain-containing protein [Actinomycetota bacterium]
MAAHPFLSTEWIEEARALHAEFIDRVSPPDEALRLNVTVIDAPFSEAEVLGHLDTTAGSLIPELGHLDNPDVAVRLPYEVARQLLVDQQYENLMIAFMSGEIEVEGDVSMVMALQDIDPTPEQRALAEEVVGRLRDITA